MGNVQAYKSQARIHGAVMPIQPGGGSMSWTRNWIVPEVAGNFSRQNAAEGLQTPSLDLQFVLLNGNASLCPIHNTILSAFFSRSNDATHDVAALANASFFDGASGWDWGFAKPAQFTISGSTGEPVRFSASYGCYVPLGGSAPAARTSTIQAYSAFTGTPISWSDCSYFTGAGYSTPLNGVVGWSLTYSNNLSPDLSQRSSGNLKFPIDMNAGSPSATFSLQFTADAAIPANHVNTGDSFAVHIATGAVSVTVIAPSLLIDDDPSRNNEAPRVMRRYTGQCLGIGNAQNQYPVFVTA